MHTKLYTVWAQWPMLMNVTSSCSAPLTFLSETNILLIIPPILLIEPFLVFDLLRFLLLLPLLLLSFSSFSYAKRTSFRHQNNRVDLSKLEVCPLCPRG